MEKAKISSILQHIVDNNIEKREKIKIVLSLVTLYKINPNNF